MIGRLLRHSRMDKFNWKFALYEILLIIAGIWLALWIDQVAQDADERKTGIQYLQMLHDELDQNLEGIDFIIQRIDSQNAFTHRLILSLHEKTDLEQKRTRFSRPLLSFNFIPIDMVLEDLIHTGHLKHIESDSLKQKIIGLKGHFERILLATENNRVDKLQRTNDLIQANILLRKSPYITGQFPEFKQFENSNYDAWLNDPTHPQFVEFENGLIIGVNINELNKELILRTKLTIQRLQADIRRHLQKK